MQQLQRFALGAAAAGIFMMGAVVASAASYSLTPWVYDPDNTGGSVAMLVTDGVHLEKNVSTPTNTAAGATINGVEGLSTTGMTLGFHVDGYCGAGAPRFNVTLSDNTVIFLGCTYGNDGSGNVSFTAGNTYGGVLFPEGATVSSIDLVQDEQGQTTLTNIMVNGVTIDVTRQTVMNQCKNGGWQTMTDPRTHAIFRNQGQCVSYMNTQ